MAALRERQWITDCDSKLTGYQREIDGLRGFAILAVLLFHLDVPQISGGYIGVDVFFVISGYLITANIHSDIENGRFSFVDFYMRRVRRLMPAAVTAYAIVFVFASISLTPIELKDFAQSIIAALSWSSNIYFWSSIRYFDLNANVKPLLHTWSLGVEMQFYIIAPLIIILLGLNRARLVLCSIILSTFIIVLIENFIFDRSVAFYFLPFRIPEFLLGACIRQRNEPEGVDYVRDVCAFAGFGMLLVAILSYDQLTPVPGYLSAGPCLGAALIIWGKGGRLLRPLITNPCLVGFGKISYSLYLVHWPIIVFFRTSTSREIDNLDRISIFTLSVALGIILYRFIEMPFRHSGRYGSVRPTKALLYVLSASALLFLLGTSAYYSSGWVWRYPPAIRKQMDLSLDERLAWDNLERLEADFSEKPNRKVLIVGDSQAGDFLNVLLNAYGDRIEFRTTVIKSQCQAVAPSEPAYYDNVPRQYADRCKAVHRSWISSRAIKKADVVILASNWRMRALTELRSTLTFLRSVGSNRVFIVGRKDQGLSGQELLRKNGTFIGLDELSATYRSEEAWKINRMIEDIAGEYFVNLMAAICPTPSKCLAKTPGDEIIFSDTLHFTLAGTMHVSSLFMEDNAFRNLRFAIENDGSRPCLCNGEHYTRPH